MSKSRNFSVTLNNYNEVELETCKKVESVFKVIGKEVGESGTPHLQMYYHFANPRSLNAMKKLFPRAHIEACKGSPAQNLEYCTKTDKEAYMDGVMPMSQKEKGESEKLRWKRAREAAEAGEFEKVDDEIYIKYYNNIKKIRADVQVSPQQLCGELINEWIYGPPRTGKSTLAFAENPGAYLKGLNKWWCGYKDQPTVIVDDMDPFHKTLTQEFKQWGHHMAFAAETKGGSLCIRPKKIVVTSNYAIDQIWEDKVTQDAMKARYKEIYVGPEKLYPIFLN